MIFSSKAADDFKVKNITSQSMETFINKCASIYHGIPPWANKEDNVKTVNFGKFICTETAKLSTLGMTIIIEGDSERVKIIQKQIDEAKGNIRQWVEYAAAYGTIVLKPNGQSVDCVLPSKYMVTDQSNGKITGIVFINQETNGKTYWTRLEYHRWIEEIYVITNKCYKGTSENHLGDAVPIEETPWKNLAEEIGIKKIDKPLFAVLKMPNANSIDVDSPLAMPIFSDAIEELKDLDVAYSRNSLEIFDSEKIILLDSDKLLVPGTKINGSFLGLESNKKKLKLPHYVRNVMGNGQEDFYEEINPALNTETRIKGINALLSQIGFKCGFSNGYFVFNETTGFTTATQVTADQARTIQLINDVRRCIDECIIDLVKAINVFEDLYGTTGHLDILDTTSTDELDRVIHLHFEPIYTNAEEDRQRALTLTNSGYYPKWYYLHMYEGLSEEEAKALTEEAHPKEKGLFEE